MAQLNAYLTFGGNCREAMTFYKEALGGKLELQTMGEAPGSEKMPKHMHDHIMHGSLEKDGVLLLMASDMMGEEKVQAGNTVNLCLNCTSEAEIKSAFENLSAGGKVGHKLEEAFWGATYGDLIDKYGMRWMFNFTKTPQQ